MRFSLLLLFLLLGWNTSASKSISIPYTLVFDSLDTSLSKKEAVYMFDLSELEEGRRSDNLVYSIDNGENLAYDYSDGDTLVLKLKPGQHIFRFYAGRRYAETLWLTLKIDKQHI